MGSVYFTINRNTFSNISSYNNSSSSVGISVSDGSNSNTFTQILTYGQSSGIEVVDSNNVVVNYSISRTNTSSGISFKGTSSGGKAQNSVLFANQDGLYLAGTASSIQATNVIAANNTNYGLNSSNLGLTIKTSISYNNTSGAYNGTYTDGGGNLTSNPLFVNSGTYDFHLQRTSPAINAGTDVSLTSDYAGTVVPQGSAPDMGAYEYIPLTVTINQAVGQSDPTNSTINFTVVFSESVSDFATGDVTLSGTAGATTATITGSSTTYNVAVTGMTGSGTVIASLAAGVATGATGNTNAASTTSDNSVSYDATGPTDPSLSSPTSYANNNPRPTLIFKKSTDASSGISSYSVSLDSGKNRSFSTSGIPTSGNGTSNYVWKDNSLVKVTFVNENDTDSGNDEIQVYFKGLDTTELSEGKHSWTVTSYDTLSNSTSQSADFYIDRTSPSISELSIANVSTVTSGGEYTLDITNRTPSFSGKASDSYQGSEKTNTNGTKDTFDKVSSGPQTITLTLKRLKDGEDPASTSPVYVDHLTKEYSLSDIKNEANTEKYSRFHITTPYPLTDGYYQVKLTLKDGTGNNYDHPVFYVSLNYKKSTLSTLTNAITQALTDNNLETEITKKETVPAQTEEEKQQIQQNGYTVKVKVVDTKQKPIEGAKVTIHSKVQETKTDKDGIALFNGVEEGEHKIEIAYANYKGEQTVNLTGDVKEFDLNIQVKPTNVFFNPQVMIFTGITGLIIIVLAVLLIKAKRKV